MATRRRKTRHWKEVLRFATDLKENELDLLQAAAEQRHRVMTGLEVNTGPEVSSDWVDEPSSKRGEGMRGFGEVVRDPSEVVRQMNDVEAFVAFATDLVAMHLRAHKQIPSHRHVERAYIATGGQSQVYEQTWMYENRSRALGFRGKTGTKQVERTIRQARRLQHAATVRAFAERVR